MKKYFSKKETCRVDSMEICELETTIDWQASKIREQTGLNRSRTQRLP